MISDYAVYHRTDLTREMVVQVINECCSSARRKLRRRVAVMSEREDRGYNDTDNSIPVDVSPAGGNTYATTTTTTHTRTPDDVRHEDEDPPL